MLCLSWVKLNPSVGNSWPAFLPLAHPLKAYPKPRRLLKQFFLCFDMFFKVYPMVFKTQIDNLVEP